MQISKNMGEILKNWESQKITSNLVRKNPSFQEKNSSLTRFKDKDEKRVERILSEMEESYQRLEKVLDIFNRMR